MLTTEALYRQDVVAHGLERATLFRLVRERFAPETVLYPDCLLHRTPSFWLQHVVYVDRHPQAVQFFAAVEDVRRFVNARRQERPPAYVRCLAADATCPLPLPEASFGAAHDAHLTLVGVLDERRAAAAARAIAGREGARDG